MTNEQRYRLNRLAERLVTPERFAGEPDYNLVFQWPTPTERRKIYSTRHKEGKLYGWRGAVSTMIKVKS